MRLAAAILATTLLLAAVPAVESAFTETVRAQSDFAAAPAFPPRALTPPAISGTPADGETLTATTGTWARDPRTLLVEWLRCAGDDCVAVGHGGSHELTPDDVGRRLRVRVTATNDGGSTTATSEPTAEIAPPTPPRPLTAPTVSGVPTVGRTLTAADGTWSGRQLAVTRRWLRCTTTCTSIAGEGDPTYLVTGDDAGATIKVEVVAANASGSATAVSAATTSVTRATYTQFLCANPATGLGVAADGALPDGFRLGGTIPPREHAETRCATGTTAGGVPLTTGTTFATKTADERVVLEYRTGSAIEFGGATVYRHGQMSGGWSWAIQTAATTNLLAMPRAELCSWREGCLGRGSATDRFAAQNRVVIAPGDVDGFNVPLACDIAAGGRCEADGTSQGVRIFGGTATLRDTATPQLTSPVTGSLTDGVLDHVEDLSLTATDAGSGVYRIRVSVDQRELASRVVHDELGRCADRDPGDGDPYEFAHRRPCATSVAASLAFDTSGWPRTGRLRVHLEDAGGNTTVLVNRRLG